MQEDSDTRTTLKFTLGRDFKSDEVQKAWSDELVKVARELDDDDNCFLISMYLNEICYQLDLERPANHMPPALANPVMLNAILNKYGRSLEDKE